MAKEHNLGNRFRQKRMAKFLDVLQPLLGRSQPVRVLDLGGTVDFWKALPGLYGHDGAEITVVNLDGEERDEANLRIRRGNACRMDYSDMTFDVVHSNSVIEHVGHWPEMMQMAAEVRRLAPAYFIQTPNIWFPVEPHFKLPLVHWLPEPARLGLLARAGKAPRDVSGATLAVQRISLLSATQMKYLFPDAKLWRERVMGITKSLVAIRSGRE
jgi:SAM-dependent methyltransferase